MQFEDFEIKLDVRTQSEFADGHLEGAQLFDIYQKDFQEKIADLPREQSYLIYCRSGSRSKGALELMKKLGFTKVAHLKRGLIGWSRGDREIES